MAQNIHDIINGQCCCWRYNYLAIGLLKQIGGMRFEANITQFWVPLLLYTCAVSLFAMIVGWSALTVKKASSRLLIIMFPTFLMSGVLMPLAMLPQLLQWISHAIPLTWYFKFVRGMGLRGGDIHYFTELLKDFGLFILILLVFVVLLMVVEMIKMKGQAVTEEPIVSLVKEETSQS